MSTTDVREFKGDSSVVRPFGMTGGNGGGGGGRGYSRGDRSDRGRVLDVNNFDAIRISLAAPEAIRA
ncbi:MAG TPA: hypothetical protein VKB09_09810, partial [Thermomicrobiales bacterium]|nr:hypothetical protein [Thermomicrobiales bacterium]